MPYFNTGKIFLVPSFDIEAKERERIERFLALLDNSGVGKIIERYIKNKELEEQVYQIIERNTIYPDWNIKAAVLSSMQLSIRKLLQKQEIGML